MGLSPAMLAMIDALAEQDAADYLTEEAARLRDSEPDRSERVSLPALDKAA